VVHRFGWLILHGPGLCSSGKSPEGFRKLAGGESHRFLTENEFRPGRGGGSRASPEIPFVIFHPAAFQKLHVFLLKRPLPMMLLLFCNVFPHRVAL